MYVLWTNPGGSVVQAEREGKLFFPIVNNKQDPAFLPVRQWAAEQSPPVNLDAKFPANAAIFFDQDSLVRFCERQNIMLFVRENRELAPLVTTVVEGGLSLDALFRAVPVPPGDTVLGSSSGITRDASYLWVTSQLFLAMKDALKRGDEPLSNIFSIPVSGAFVYLDVSDFSGYPPAQQVLVINTINSIVDYPPYWDAPGAGEASQSLETRLCIGDGYIFVFKDPLKATFFAAYLAELIQQLSALRERMGPRGIPIEFHFRMAVHCGPVYRFFDPGRKDWNFIGEGINGGNRVLNVIEKSYDDVLYVSDQIVRAARSQPANPPFTEIRSHLESRGRRKDKHDKPWRVFLLNHDRLCGGYVSQMIGTLLPTPP